MNLAEHGGGCCGIHHLFNFDNGTVAEFNRLYNAHFTEGNNNRVLEVVLSERQVTGNRWSPCVVERGGWPAILAEKGFRLVGRFTNSNSGRICYIFHKNTEWLPHTIEALPFPWGGDIVIPTVPVVNRIATPNLRQTEIRHINPASVPLRIGDRVRYVFGPGRGNSTNLDQRIGIVMSVGRRLIFVRWELERGTDEFERNRFDLIERPGEFTVGEEAPAPEPVVPPVEEVYAFYFAHLRTGTKYGPYETEVIAREVHPRCRLIVRRAVMSDGSTVDNHL